MTPRRIAYLGALAALIPSGLYVFIYLYRWEWNRALFSAMVFVAAEGALIGFTVLDRLGRIERRLNEAERRPAPPPEVLARLRETAPPASEHFAWLDPRDAPMGVFVPVLLGAGVLVSGLAWLVERVARSTAGPVLEQGLARRLAALAWPSGGLVPADGGDHEVLHDILRRPLAPRR